MSALRQAAQQALEALVIGSDAAHEVAQNYHEAMAGYRPARHIAVDDDVRKIEAAITGLRAALAEPDDEPIYCPTCGEEDGGTTCGMPECGLRCGAEPVQEPVAKVELMLTGGNAGLATRIVEIDDHLRERLRPGQLLYTTPPQRKPLRHVTYVCPVCAASLERQE